MRRELLSLFRCNLRFYRWARCLHRRDADFKEAINAVVRKQRRCRVVAGVVAAHDASAGIAIRNLRLDPPERLTGGVDDLAADDLDLLAVAGPIDGVEPHKIDLHFSSSNRVCWPIGKARADRSDYAEEDHRLNAGLDPSAFSSPPSVRALAWPASRRTVPSAGSPRRGHETERRSHRPSACCGRFPGGRYCPESCRFSRRVRLGSGRMPLEVSEAQRRKCS